MISRVQHKCDFGKCLLKAKGNDFWNIADVPVWKEVSDANEDQPQFGKQLSEQQCAELGTLLKEFSDVMKTIPGRTNLVEHDIQTGEAHPVRLPPYRLPHAYRDSVQNEIQEMLHQEPSSHTWMM